MPLPPGVKRREREEETTPLNLSFLPGGIDRPTIQQPGGPQPEPVSKFPEGVQRRRPTLTSEARVETFARSATRGFADTLPFAGAMVGAATAGPAGLVLGGGAGIAGRQALIDFIDIPTIEEVPENLRSTAVFGEAVGGTLSIGGAPFAMARTGFRTGGRFLDRVLETINRAPGTVAVAEAASAVTAGTGGAIAENIAPGSIGARISGEVIGGFLSPGNLLLAARTAGTGAFNRAISTLGKEGRERAAASELQRIFREVGEDPVALAKALPKLLKELPEGATPTAAQLSSSPTLLLLESEMARRSAKFGREASKQGADTLTILRNSVDVLTRIGTPETLKEATVLRARYFETLIAGRLRVAEQEAVEAVKKLGGTGAAPSASSRAVSDILDTALKNARNEEKRLYALVPDGEAGASNFLAEANRIRAAEIPIDEPELFPKVANRFTKRIEDLMEGTPAVIDKKTGDVIEKAVEGLEAPTTIHQLRLLRTGLLEDARIASAEGKTRLARILGNLAEAALDDLNEVTGTTGPLQVARDYSKALNDVFTRTFVGTTEATARTGARRIPPELLLRRAAGTGNELGELRLKELRDAVEFGDPEAAKELLRSQEEFLRSMAEELIDENTGQITVRALARFRRQKKDILQAFPEFSAQLQSVKSAQKLLAEGKVSATRAGEAINKRAAFARVAQTENPVEAVQRILTGARPQEEFRQLAIVARRDGEAAVVGLQRSVMDSAFQRSGGGTDAFSFERFRSLLFDPVRPGQPSAIEMMRKSGVIKASTETRLAKLIDQAASIAEAIKTGDKLEGLLENGSALFDLVLRIAGAQTGTRLSTATGGQGGSQLIVASASSRFARTLFDRIPAKRVQDVFIEASKDPLFMATLIKRAGTPKERLSLGMRLHAFFFQAGILGAESELRQEQQQ